MTPRFGGAAAAAVLLIALHPNAGPDLLAQQIAGAPPGTDLFAGREWGDAGDGVQLRLTPAWAAEERAARDGLLFLALQIRHTLKTPLAVDAQRVTYQFEYEIDGAWHGFEALAAPATANASTLTVRPGTPMWLSLILPLNSPTRSLQLRPTTPGPGGALVWKPGPHSLRVRARPGTFGATVRAAPVSNVVTVSIPALSAATATPSTPPVGSSSKLLRFVAGPPDGRAIVEQMLRQPPSLTLAGAPRLARAGSLDIVGPAEQYSLVLPRRIDVADPPLPSGATEFVYVVNADARGAAAVMVRTETDGRARLTHIDPGSIAEPLARALDQVAGLEQVRNGSYEPRLLRVIGWAGTPPRLVIWLRSTSGAPDVFYQPRNPDARVTPLMEFERLYTGADFFKAVRQLPVMPRHDEAWAISTAAACAKDIRGAGGGPLLVDNGVAEISVSDAQDGIVWRVHFPEQTTDRIVSHPGANFTVDESTGLCGRFYVN